MIDAEKNLLLVYPVPEAGWNVPTRVASAIQFNERGQKTLPTSEATYEKRTARTRRILDAVSPPQNFLRVRPAQLFCNNVSQDRCTRAENGMPLDADDDHVDTQGATITTSKIIQAFEDSAWLQN